jgi:hypothetical protein
MRVESRFIAFSLFETTEMVTAKLLSVWWKFWIV